MTRSPRQEQIIQQLRLHGSLRVAELASQLGVSRETIRRDVAPLARAGDLIKVHGSVRASLRASEAPFERRMRENAEAKQRLAVYLAEVIEDGDSVMLDTGTTTSFLARELLKKSSLTIVTNSSDVARTLATVNGNTVYMAGGELHGDNGAAFGRSAIEFVASFTVKHAIISISAVDPATGFMDYHLAEAEFARQVLRCGQQRIVVTDSSKFSRTALVRVCGFDGLDLLVCDEAPPEAIQRRLLEGGARFAVV
ncbi:DeoR/GlpR family DNA-binding transcription regulator [Salaquimonas pukyongi]|uniref:DeoR/GlpR family DNA-binding transcription regulator n=1 Tax=Salaquimonas pukyongi TaxID=2712698 RepID=UPI00096B94F1|nr:DeoR/GlpR family DNA-binding transcription regulator [Salaquimonas pukyongi]